MKHQRGSLLIVTVVLIVVMSGLAAALVNMMVGSVSGQVDHARSTEALFIAESGLERGIRQWSLAPATYPGEGPVGFGAGDFTVTVSNTDGAGNPLPAGQKRIASLGRVASSGGDVLRTTEVIAQSGGAGIVEPFEDIADWNTSGPSGDTFNQECPPAVDNTTVASNDGSVFHDPGDDAPGSTGGSFRAETDPFVLPGGRLTGYRQRTLSAPISAGSNITLDFWHKKLRGRPNPDHLHMFLDLVAANGTIYRVWSDCSNQTPAWTAAPTINWTVPAGTSLTAIRLGYDLQNRTKNGGGPQRRAAIVQFDEVVLGAPGPASTGAVSWREVTP